MSKKRIEKYIPEAMKVLDATFENGIVPSSYNGYISSFGASIIQSGLKPTLALFENENAKTEEKKQLLPRLILQVLEKDSEETSLLHYVLQRKEQELFLKQKILDISIAIKLCIRTFKLDKGKKDE